ncbi:MAG: hypothetical protein FWE33_07125 [Defluviitaleaceae bacterium]|nr:hypothetical protein [Defluviitaleaceae bacterium]
MGKELVVVHTVFMYRINVALAVLLLFINLQIFVNTALIANAEEMSQNSVLIIIIILVFCLAYGFLSLNGMLTKITVYDGGIEFKSIIQRRRLENSQIAKVAFARKDKIRLRITLIPKEGKPLIINAAKFKDNQPVIDFCGQFDRT